MHFLVFFLLNLINSQFLSKKEEEKIDNNDIKIVDINISQINITKEYIKELINNYINNNNIYKIHQYKSKKFLITIYKQAYNNINNIITLNISFINLTEYLKQFDNNSIVNLQIDFYNNSYKVFYLLFSITTGEILNLNHYNNKIIIYKYINLNEKQIEKYKDLNLKGYNIFNINDKFYNDICSIYSNDKGKDVLLKDRIKDYYNLSLPKEYNKCDFSSFDLINRRIKCEIDVNKDFFNIINYNGGYNKKLEEEIIKSYYFSNIIAMKCYSQFFTAKNIFSNFCSIISIIFILCLIIVVIRFYLTGEKNIERNLEVLIFKNFLIYNSSNTNGDKTYDKKEKEKIVFDYKGSFFDYFNFNSRNKPKDLIYDTNTKQINNNTNTNIKKEKENIDKMSIISSDNNSLKKIKEEKENKEKINSYLNEELNWLNYDDAIALDKREWLEVYCSYLMQRHLIFFTFFSNDYSLKETKIGLFIISISLYFLSSMLFFFDYTLHEIYSSNNFYDFNQQILIILLSLIFNNIVRFLLKKIFLQEKIILNIRKSKNVVDARKVAFYSVKKLKKKTIIIFIFYFFILFIFWYIISCFSTVFTKAAIILIIDVIICILFEFSYPFIIGYFFFAFRIISIEDISKNKKCLYKISQILSLI